jgi:hypothetical protein
LRGPGLDHLQRLAPFDVRPNCRASFRIAHAPLFWQKTGEGKSGWREC